MESHFSQRWYGTNTRGQHTYYIEVYSSDLMEDFVFETSLPIDYFKSGELFDLAIQLCNSELTNHERNAIAQNIIIILDFKPGTAEHYFADYVLDKRGNYCEAYENVLIELNRPPTIKEFVPYSQYSNENIFSDLKNNFKYEDMTVECKKIERSVFERYIEGKTVFQKEYAKIYAGDAEYYCQSSSDDLLIMEFYCVVIAKSLAFLFFTKLQEVGPFKF